MGLKEAEYKNDLVDFYSKYIKLKTDGTSMGIKCKWIYWNRWIIITSKLYVNAILELIGYEN